MNTPSISDVISAPLKSELAGAPVSLVQGVGTAQRIDVCCPDELVGLHLPGWP